MKKVTKKLAKEIATKFFGKAVKLVEDIDPTKQRVFYNDGYLFENGVVQLNVFPCFGGKGKGFEYPNEYPCGQVLVNRVVTCHLRYVDGEFETENCIHNEYEELRNVLFTIHGLIGDAIDEEKIDTTFDWNDRWIVKDKSKLLKALKALKDTEHLKEIYV